MDFQHNQTDIKIFPLVVIRRAGLSFSVLDAWTWDGDAVQSSLINSKEAAESHRQALLQNLDKALPKLPEGPERSAVYNARKCIFKGKRPSAAQQADLPADLHAATADWLQALKGQADTEATAQQAYGTALLKGYDFIRSMAEHPDICAALLYASHDLLGQLPTLLEKSPSDWRKKEKQTAHALARYIVRAATKTSPFSRLTTVGIQQEEVPDADFLQNKYSVTPNVGLLPAIYDVLLRQPTFFRSLQVRLNPCIVQAGASYEWLYYNGEQEGFQQTPGNPLLNNLVDWLLTQQRRAVFTNISGYLREITDAGEQPLETWMQELLDTGFLEWVLPETGLSPSWAGNLYQYLGALAAEPVIVDTAMLLQWLRTVARTLPYQDIPAAIQAQQDALRHLKDYFERYEGHCPDIPAERLFYEDVEHSVPVIVPQETLAQFADSMEQRRRETPSMVPSGLHADFQEFIQQQAEPIPWLSAARAFLEAGRPTASQVVQAPVYQGKTGALLQPFREQGRWKAVVNALYPGGGKMLARWVHLFPPVVQQKLRTWNQASDGLAAFPFQGWYNANFQPSVCPADIQAPGGRSNNPTAALLGNLQISVDQNALKLVDAGNLKTLHFTDLGLEAPTTRPPAMQLLWHSGVPYVSVHTLLPELPDWTSHTLNHWRHRPRQEAGDLVLARATWLLEKAAYENWQGLMGFAFFKKIRADLMFAGVPRRFFAHLEGEKPQYFDLESPLMMVLLEKILHRAEKPLYISEMLPIPELCPPTAEQHAFEIALEWDLK